MVSSKSTQWFSPVRRSSFVVFSMMDSLVCFSKLWSSWAKCLYRGRCVFILDADLCSAILVFSDLAVSPMYWFPLWHLVHSMR